MGQSLKSQSGASLVEIIVTVLIIAVTTLMIMSFSRNSLKMGKHTRSNDAGYISAEEKIAELSLQPFAASGSDNDTIDRIIMNRSWTIADYQTIKRATITVTFPNSPGETVTLTGAVN